MTCNSVSTARVFLINYYTIAKIENCMTKASKTAALRVRERRKPIRNQET